MITGGFLEPLGDLAGGVIGLVLSVLLLCISLATLCKLLQIIFMSKAKHIAKLSINMNGYFAIVAGAGITVLVQSSSVVTSALTPVCAIGVLALHKMFPITLGTNIGTTCTALIASLVDLKQSGVQIALCHFFFNFIGILIWFPIPLMRSVPINAAHLLGLYASFYRYLPAMYILIVFFALPGVALMVSACFNTHLVLGLCVLFVIIASFIIFELWWWRGFCAGNPGSFWFLSKEKRVAAQTELINANAAIMSVTPEEYVKKCELSWFG